MADSSVTLDRIQSILDRLRRGEAKARDELINVSCHRLLHLTRKMLKRFARVRRWEETGDVAQNAAVRLHRALGQVTPADAREFFKLASVQIRRELLDLVKHYYGPHGLASNVDGRSPQADAPDSAADPLGLALWSEFHAQVGTLPDAEREVFDLLWYQGLRQAEVARILDVDVRTVQRRWFAARIALVEKLGGELPPGE